MTQLVFVDGHFTPSLSSIPPQIVCLPMQEAHKTYGLFLKKRWTHLPDTGVFVYVPPNIRLTAPIHLLHVFNGPSPATPLLQIVVGKGSSIEWLQSSQFLTDTPHMNGTIDFALEAGASAKFVDVQLLPKEARSSFSIRSTLKRDANLSIFHATNGAKEARFSANAELLEEQGNALLEALAMLSGERRSDIHALMEHAAPHCTSRQTIKMALSGQSRSHFEGKIYVRPIAQKTEAYQLNKQLLLSDQAIATAKPNLEIFADDVKASHGATVSQLNDEELFYLCSRGLSPSIAKSLLIEGFCRELIDKVPHMQAALLEEMRKL
jgi:Fe-S cluster assembly protein SufD